MLQRCFDNNFNEIQIGVDEAGRGSLAGPVFAGAVIFDPNFEHEKLSEIKDSKKMTRKKRDELKLFIEKNALAFSVESCDNSIIDEINILNATYNAMHKALHKIYENIKFNHIIVDGNRFKTFVTKDGFIKHTCVVKGDSKYLNIAAASILAKTYHDDCIDTLCNNNPDFEKYGWRKNMCYGTKQHINAIREYGLTEYHRKSYKINLFS